MLLLLSSRWFDSHPQALILDYKIAYGALRVSSSRAQASRSSIASRCWRMQPPLEMLPERPSLSPIPPRSLVVPDRSEEHTSELQSLMRITYAVFCLYKKNNNTH